MSAAGAVTAGVNAVAYKYDGQNCDKGIDNNDKRALSLLWAGLSAAIAAYNTGQAIDFALRQHSIAKDYLKISQWWHNYHVTYFQPLEDQELADAYAAQEATPYYDTMRGRAQTVGRLKFKNSVKKTVQCTSEYCSGLRQQLLYDTLEQEAKVMSTLTGLGYRNERDYVEGRSDIRWKKLINTASRGRDMHADAINSAQLAYGIYGNLGKQAAQGAQGAATAAGYFWNRNETHYPTLMRVDPVPQQQNTRQTTNPTNNGPISGYVRDKDGVFIPATAQQMGGN